MNSTEIIFSELNPVTNYSFSEISGDMMHSPNRVNIYYGLSGSRNRLISIYSKIVPTEIDENPTTMNPA